MKPDTVSFIYRWQIPPDLHESFLQQWEELSKINVEKYGLIDANLYRIEPDNFVSVTQWPDEESWKKWKENDANHEYRERWRPYRIAGPEQMSSIVKIANIKP